MFMSKSDKPHVKFTEIKQSSTNGTGGLGASARLQQSQCGVLTGAHTATSHWCLGFKIKARDKLKLPGDPGSVELVCVAPHRGIK